MTVTTAAELAAIIACKECFCGHGKRQHNSLMGGCTAESVKPSDLQRTMGAVGRGCPCGSYQVPEPGEERDIDYYRELGEYAL